MAVEQRIICDICGTIGATSAKAYVIDLRFRLEKKGWTIGRGAWGQIVYDWCPACSREQQAAPVRRAEEG